MNLDENRFTTSAGLPKPDSAIRRHSTTTWFALYGFLFVSLALFAYVTGVLLGPLRWLLLDPPLFRRLNEGLVWYSGVPLVLGALLISWDLFRNVPRIRQAKSVRNDPPASRLVTVTLTAYNDERSIGGAVRDVPTTVLPSLRLLEDFERMEADHDKFRAFLLQRHTTI